MCPGSWTLDASVPLSHLAPQAQKYLVSSLLVLVYSLQYAFSPNAHVRGSPL